MWKGVSRGDERIEWLMNGMSMMLEDLIKKPFGR
jgi:hypothetical protein